MSSNGTVLDRIEAQIELDAMALVDAMATQLWTEAGKILASYGLPHGATGSIGHRLQGALLDLHGTTYARTYDEPPAAMLRAAAITHRREQIAKLITEGA